MKHWKGVMAVSTAHHPQTDGQTEIVNAALERMLCAFVENDRSSWAKYISALSFAYNSSVHSSTGKTPSFLLLGYHPQVQASVLNPLQRQIARPIMGEDAKEFEGTFQMYRQAARDALAHAQELQARAYNKNRVPVKEFKVGELALINPHSLELVDVEGTGKKLVQKYLGPFEVIERINPVVYRLRLPSQYPMHPVFNLQHLKRYHPSPPRFGERETLQDPRMVGQKENEYEVESILGHRDVKRKGKMIRQYRIRWKGYDATEDKWVSETALRNAPVLKREYLNTLAFK